MHMTEARRREPTGLRRVAGLRGRDDDRRLRRPVDAQSDDAAVGRAADPDSGRVETPGRTGGALESARGAWCGHSEKPCIRSFSHRFLREMPRISAADGALAVCLRQRALQVLALELLQRRAQRARDGGQLLGLLGRRARCRAGRWLMSMSPPSASTAACSMACPSSRTLPGKGNCDSAFQAARRQRRDLASGLRELLQEVLHQQRQVPLALAQRRDVDVQHVQPVVEVLAEQAARDALFEVAVGGRDDAHVDPQATRWCPAARSVPS